MIKLYQSVLFLALLSMLLIFRGFIILREDPNFFSRVPPNRYPISSIKYWEDHSHMPFKPLTNKYITWCTWGGGINNRRMSLELTVALAVILNRTLVLPMVPPYWNYTFQFEFEDLKRFVSVVTWEEFYVIRNISQYPHFVYYPLKDPTFHNISYVWNTFPSPTINAISWPDIVNESHPGYKDMMEFKSGRPNLVSLKPLLPLWENSEIIHIPEGLLFGHWYTLFHFVDPAYRKWIRRGFREHVHYRSEIYEYVEAILNTIPNRNYSSMHIRRTDFLGQQPHQDIPLETIFNNTKNLFHEGEAIWIATDLKKEEWDLNYASIWNTRYKVFMLHDYTDNIVKDLTNDTLKVYGWIDIVDQIMCTMGRVFVGTKLSTYSGGVVRMRGFNPEVKNKEKYFTDTRYPEGYLPPQDHLQLFVKCQPSWKLFWWQLLWGTEHPEVWEGLDD
eukprot:TRINITY_DN7634_c0_g1_i1.p1 TRINITY_DN7634_c0_g1~~TRINITY_DN7634_c0_g1_i1.p1  ORF type:complete len:445 (+),score=66.38 TRINITY_DN7634_c0_g1_i1:90-1424(+)